jgi:hypothetical protein
LDVIPVNVGRHILIYTVLILGVLLCNPH